jgi:uncharacterized protein YdaU (DUF1376 family)
MDTPEPPATRICTKCHQDKSLEEFQRCAKGKYGRKEQCRECRSVKKHPSSIRHKEPPVAKICTQCGIEKYINEFFRWKYSSDGYMSYCKQCSKERVTDWLNENPAYQTNRYKKNRDKIRSRRKEIYQANKEEVHEKRQIAELPKRSEINAKQNERRKKNVNHYRDRDRGYYQALPPEKRLARHQEQYQKNPQMFKDNAAKRRLRLKHVTIIDNPTVEEIAERDGWICHICRKKVDRNLPPQHPMAATRDHHFPISLPAAIHGRQYISLAHRSCNTSRGTGRLPVQLFLLDFSDDQNPVVKSLEASRKKKPLRHIK